MCIYDELTGEKLTSPDLTVGYLYDGQRVARHIPETRRVMDGTITPRRPQGLQERVPAHDEYEDCQYYHKYTADELAERNRPTLQDQIDANAAAITEIAMMMAGGDT